MDCWTAQRRISGYLDGAGSEWERREISRHLSGCRTCAGESERYRRVCEALRSLPQRTPPSDLTIQLRVAASKARAEAAGAAGWRDRFQLFRSNLMRPLALPTMGGLCSAVFLFSTLVPTFKSAFALDKNPWDVPTMLSTEPTLKFMAPMASFDGDAVVDLQLDRQGRIVNYSIVSAPDQTSDHLRRNIENSLLFTEFWPATAFGRPVTGTVRISFRSSHIDVRG
jgi:hypothetical protein